MTKSVQQIPLGRTEIKPDGNTNVHKGKKST